MVKKELLSPAGDMESLSSAIHAGCDAVYIGGEAYGARKFSKNFNYKELEEAVNYAHLYGVKVYVTVNTMIYEEEMESVLEYVSYLKKIHVDAVIVQDIGLICEIRRQLPNLEIHASTQLHNYCEENFYLLEKLGVKRVVLAREVSLEEVNNIKTPLEKEVFIHGAICISYSGQCLFSSFVLNRSGNRGECAGMCRLPYSMEDSYGKKVMDTYHLLSPKELSTISKFRELMDSDITCFKIEGRMKSPAYVYLVTKIYRTLIDNYYQGKTLQIESEVLRNLKVLFNRKFTLGHLFGKTNFDLMNIESPNHQGILLGHVKSITKDKIGIELIEDIHQEDGIRFASTQKGMFANFLYDKDGLLVSKKKKGEVVFVDNKVGLERADRVLKTVDKHLLEQLSNYDKKRIPVDIKVIAKVDQPLVFEITDYEHTIRKIGNLLEVAKNRSTTKEEIYEHIDRLGNTPYILNSATIELSSQTFVPMKVLNELRKDAILELTNRRIFRDSDSYHAKYAPKKVKIQEKLIEICCLVRNEKQLLALKDYSLARIYVTDYELYQKYYLNINNLYYRTERINDKKRTNRNIITELAQLSCESSFISDYYLNVANLSYLKFLEEMGCSAATLSVEMKPHQIKNLVEFNDTSLNIEVVVYGRIELMVMKYNPVELSNLDYKENDVYYLIDRNKERYPFFSCNGITHLLSSRKTNYSEEELKEILESGVDFIRLEFFDETEEEVINILKKYQQIIENCKNCDKIKI